MRKHEWSEAKRAEGRVSVQQSSFQTLDEPPTVDFRLKSDMQTANNICFWVLLSAIAILCLDGIVFGIWLIVTDGMVVPDVFPGVGIISFATGVGAGIGYGLTQ